ncbi:histone deacetylase superfamily protein [Luminiphilus syltensis NOR5-1B]|uniref:Histone deacetylase superfamily protein n=1 Tax=Luminiphilus syltensis NOR5-1B TaxID=565045 RepID=B8KT62_9GAMM|nr:class II histone deacetylase [Luminiphilus syltensis]EED35345.1 histone deacetylase superfamily protein [Luminiphilus syltensis NOR5-1B]
MAATRKTGFVCHELYMWHNTGNYAGPLPYGNPIQPDTHAENPETKRRFRNLMEVSGMDQHMTALRPRMARDEEILRFHTPEHLERVKTVSASGGGDAGILTPMGAGSFEIAMLSAGGCLVALEAVLSGDVDNAYALVRPPGHHAVADAGMGFCLFGNAAIAGFSALEDHGLQRIAFVDWDVHHGNGTQSAFYDDPRALTISIHQDNCFPPDSGHVHERGESAGEGYNVNIPLPPGSGVGAYEAAFEQVVIPALDAYQPEVIIVPSGFDAGAYDPLGRMQMTSDSYRNLTSLLLAAADRHCGGRLLMTHEGGYNSWTVPFFGLAVMETLSGIRTSTEDPFLPLHAGLGGQSLQPHQQVAIDAAKTSLDVLIP